MASSVAAWLEWSKGIGVGGGWRSRTFPGDFGGRAGAQDGDRIVLVQGDDNAVDPDKLLEHVFFQRAGAFGLFEVDFMGEDPGPVCQVKPGPGDEGSPGGGDNFVLQRVGYVNEGVVG